MSVGKVIYNSNFKFKNHVIEIKQSGFSRVRVELSKFYSANELVNLEYLKKKNNFESYIPSYFIHKLGVIRNVHPSLTEDELLSTIKCNMKVISVRRVTKKVKK